MVEGRQEEFYTDMNGVPQPRSSLSAHQYTEEEMRAMKQNYLMENVINTGYDPASFAQFMEYKMGKLFFHIQTKTDYFLIKFDHDLVNGKSILFLTF